MGFANKGDDGFWIVIGTHGGKPVRLKVRTITNAAADKCRREAYGKLKGRQLGTEPAVKLYERAKAETIERAIYEALDSDNFTLGLAAADVELYGKALGREVKAGEDVVLDGHWTDEVRRDVFENIEGLAKRVDDKTSARVLGELAEEEEDSQGF